MNEPVCTALVMFLLTKLCVLRQTLNRRLFSLLLAWIYLIVLNLMLLIFLKWDLTQELLYTFVVWSLLRQLVWLSVRQRLTSDAAVGLKQLLGFRFGVFLLSLSVLWLTFHYRNWPFSSGPSWYLGRGCSLRWRSTHTQLCGSLWLYVRVLIPYSSWKYLGQEQWPPVLCQRFCRQIRAAAV